MDEKQPLALSHESKEFLTEVANKSAFSVFLSLSGTFALAATVICGFINQNTLAIERQTKAIEAQTLILQGKKTAEITAPKL